MLNIYLIIEILLTLLIVVLADIGVVITLIFIHDKLSICYRNRKYKRWYQKNRKERAEYRKKQEIKKRERELRKKEMSTHPLFYWKQTCKPTLRIKE